MPDREPHIILRTRIVNGGATNEIIPDLRGWPGRPQDLTVKVVCKTCNNGWMASLEAQVMPVLRRLESGEPTVLGREDAVVLATWATKTAMMYQYNDPLTKVCDDAQRASLRAELRPPPGVKVWLLRTAGLDWKMAICHTGAVLDRESGAAASRTVATSRTGGTTLGVGQTLLYVHMWNGPDANAASPRVPATGRELWPSSEPVQWPLEVTPNDVVTALSRWPSVAYS
jgi:hypothetical protein